MEESEQGKRTSLHHSFTWLCLSFFFWSGPILELFGCSSRTNPNGCLFQKFSKGFLFVVRFPLFWHRFSLTLLFFDFILLFLKRIAPLRSISTIDPHYKKKFLSLQETFNIHVLKTATFRKFLIMFLLTVWLVFSNSSCNISYAYHEPKNSRSCLISDSLFSKNIEQRTLYKCFSNIW